MPDQFSDDWTRVRDRETGHEVTVPAALADADHYERIDKPAVDVNGVPLDPKPRVLQRPAASATPPASDGPSAAKEK